MDHMAIRHGFTRTFFMLREILLFFLDLVNLNNLVILKTDYFCQTLFTIVWSDIPLPCYGKFNYKIKNVQGQKCDPSTEIQSVQQNPNKENAF